MTFKLNTNKFELKQTMALVLFLSASLPSLAQAPPEVLDVFSEVDDVSVTYMLDNDNFLRFNSQHSDPEYKHLIPIERADKLDETLKKRTSDIKDNVVSISFVEFQRVPEKVILPEPVGGLFAPGIEIDFFKEHVKPEDE